MKHVARVAVIPVDCDVKSHDKHNKGRQADRQTRQTDRKKERKKDRQTEIILYQV